MDVQRFVAWSGVEKKTGSQLRVVAKREGEKLSFHPEKRLLDDAMGNEAWTFIQIVDALWWDALCDVLTKQIMTSPPETT